MSEDFRARIKHKRDNSANWTQNNPVILNGEIIIVDTDNGVRIKVGDGVKKYTQLPFDDELLRSLIDEKVPISQGASEAGKVMKVNSSGDIIPSTIEGSGNISVTNTDSGINIGMSGSTKVNTTLSASSWSTAKNYIVLDSNITATSVVELLPREGGGITQAQMEALSGAMIVGGTQFNGSIQLIALGDKPTISIPVTLIIRRDL